MTIPSQTLTRVDGGLGPQSSEAERFLLLGISSSGTNNTLYQLTSSKAYRDALGQGEVVEAAAWILDNAKMLGRDITVDVVKVPTGTAGVASAITKSGTGPTVTVAGTPRLPFSVVLLITLGGALGVARFSYTLDGGSSYTDPITVPAGGTYAIPNTGLTLTFPVGPYILAETYTFTCGASTFDADDVTTGLVPILASDDTWTLVAAVCTPPSAAAGAALAAAMNAAAADLLDTNRYSRVIVPTGADTQSAISVAFDAINNELHTRVTGTAKLQLRTGWTGWRNPTLPYIIEFLRRCAAVAPATNPAWAGLEDPVARSMVSSPSVDEFKDGDLYHQYRIVAPRTYRNKAGVYPTCALTGATTGSDFKHLQWCRVMDIASSVIEEEQQSLINESGPTLTDGTGRIAPEWAAQIKDVVDKRLREELSEEFTSEGRKGFVSAFEYQPDQTNDLLTTGLYKSTFAAVPLANISSITTTLGFVREIS